GSCRKQRDLSTSPPRARNRIALTGQVYSGSRARNTRPRLGNGAGGGLRTARRHVRQIGSKEPGTRLRGDGSGSRPRPRSVLVFLVKLLARHGLVGDLGELKDEIDHLVLE